MHDGDMRAAVPPKLIQPNFHQNRTASVNIGWADSSVGSLDNYL
jgi:prepilin-type processing-associated H-X9-DG protein